MASFTVKHARPASFYPLFERKSALQHQTHYCPGCGHGIVHKLLAEAIYSLGVQDRTILISPVGCSVFAYYYFDVGNIQVAHGRAPAVATGVKRSRPDGIVIAYQGDGDLGAIGTAEIVHAANRGEPVTIVFVNNGIYGMTGGQMAPTTPLGKKTTTSPFGRTALNEGYPLHICELLATLEAPVFIERVSLADNKQIMKAAKVLHKAVQNQVRGLGFSLVEVLSPCPTIWKMDPLEAQRFVREEMAAAFAVGNYRDRTQTATPRPPAPAAPDVSQLPRILGLTNGQNTAEPAERPPALDRHVKVAGFGGQGVLMLGEVLAEAGLDSAYHVSWLPSYGPEMRSGTSNCHVRISSREIDSPMVSRPDVLLALNEPSLRKFLPDVAPQGLVLYNGEELPEGCARPGLQMLALPFTRIADELGISKAGNMVVLGALLEITDMLEQEQVTRALRRLVKSDKWFDIDVMAIERGREEARKAVLPVEEDYLWGV